MSLPAPVVNDTRMSTGASRRGFDHPETGAGTLTQRHAVLIGTDEQRVESVCPRTQGAVGGWDGPGALARPAAVAACQSPACLSENEGATVPLKVPAAIKRDRAVHKPSSKSGSLTMLAAIRLASSRVSSFAARRATAHRGIEHVQTFFGEGAAGGGTNCGFTTFEQCMETARGLGSNCQPNTQYQPPPGPHPATRLQRRNY